MAIVDKLKSLYVKMGGDENTSASNIEEWVNKLEEVAGNGSSGSGSGSGGGTFFVPLNVSEDHGNILYTATKTAHEIIAAVNAGLTVTFKANEGQTAMTANLVSFTLFPGDTEESVNAHFALATYIDNDGRFRGMELSCTSLDDYPVYSFQDNS